MITLTYHDMMPGIEEQPRCWGTDHDTFQVPDIHLFLAEELVSWLDDDKRNGLDANPSDYKIKQDGLDIYIECAGHPIRKFTVIVNDEQPATIN